MKILLFLLITLPAYPQISAGIYDEDTKKAIPFVNVWVLGKDKGTIANESGQFLIESFVAGDTIALSSIGYQNKVVRLLRDADTIFLKPQPILLDEVVIGRKANKKIKIGNLKNKETLIADFTESGNTDGKFCIARYFLVNAGYHETPYLAKVTVRAYAKYKNQYFAISVRSVGKNGKPNNFLNTSPILCPVKRGKRSLLEVDLSALNIKVPDEGFYITIEKYLKDHEIDKSFGPFVVLSNDATNKGTLAWRYIGGRLLWDKFSTQEIIMEVQMSN